MTNMRFSGTFWTLSAFWLVGLFAIAGCRAPAVDFPAVSVVSEARLAGAAAAYDTDGDGVAELFGYANQAGRIDRIAYVTAPTTHQAGEAGRVIIDLDALPAGRCRHLVIILDGFGYDVVRDYYDAGGLRMFHPPAKVVAPYPTLTDPSIEDILGYVPCRAFEAMYFDRSANRLSGGAWDYLAGENQPYNDLLDYRADLLWDAIGYVASWEVFEKEIHDIKRLFDARSGKETIVYLVSSAGVSTVAGQAGQVRCLQMVEQLVNQVIFETRGLTKVTLLADHGHSYSPAQLIDLEEHLKGNGWRLTKSLSGPRDVVYVQFGLLTYASFATNSPADLAGDLVACKGVQLASFATDDTVVVLAPDGQRAVIARDQGNHDNHARFSYTPSGGDPLEILAVLATLEADQAGFYDADELLAATVDHKYPAPLQRLWRAHFGLVENVPDVIISLADNFYAGSASFAGSVDIASTHGGLNRNNSVTFIMSTAGELSGPMRSADIPDRMENMLGWNWPACK